MREYRIVQQAQGTFYCSEYFYFLYFKYIFLIILTYLSTIFKYLYLYIVILVLMWRIWILPQSHMGVMLSAYLWPCSVSDRSGESRWSWRCKPLSVGPSHLLNLFRDWAALSGSRWRSSIHLPFVTAVTTTTQTDSSEWMCVFVGPRQQSSLLFTQRPDDLDGQNDGRLGGECERHARWGREREWRWEGNCPSDIPR